MVDRFLESVLVRRLLFPLWLIFLALFIIGPIGWMFLASFQTRQQLVSNPITWVAIPPYFGSYKQVLNDPALRRGIMNSLFLAPVTTLITITIASLAAYAYARLRFPHKWKLFFASLSTQLLPLSTVLIPIYVMMRIVKLIHTYQGLIIVYVALTLPFAIWLLTAYFRTIPEEIEDAARIDGCTRIGVIFRIILPLAMPGLISTAIFTYIAIWNEFMIALLLGNQKTQGFPVKIASYIGEELTNFDVMFAGASVVTVPILIMVFIAAPRIVEGLTAGASK